MARAKKLSTVGTESNLNESDTPMNNESTTPVESPAAPIDAAALSMAIESTWTPPAKVRKGRAEKYPFSALEVGQSFLVAGKTAKDLYGTAYSASKRIGVKLSVHDVESGVRVYREA